MQHAGGSHIETITRQLRCLFTSEHKTAATADIGVIRNRGPPMLTRREQATDGQRTALQQPVAAASRRGFRPDRTASDPGRCQSQRRCSTAPAPTSRSCTSRAARAWCPTWSPNEDGRDVETILVGREGAVGGIVSQGYLPAYTRICVKFGGPVRAAASRQAGYRESQVADRCATSSRATPTACWRRSSSRPPATRSTRSSSAPRNGSSRRWSAPTATTSCR